MIVKSNLLQLTNIVAREMNYYHDFIIVKDKSNRNKTGVLLVDLLELNVILCGVDPFNSALTFLHVSGDSTILFGTKL